MAKNQITFWNLLFWTEPTLSAVIEMRPMLGQMTHSWLVFSELFLVYVIRSYIDEAGFFYGVASRNIN